MYPASSNENTYLSKFFNGSKMISFVGLINRNVIAALKKRMLNVLSMFRILFQRQRNGRVLQNALSYINAKSVTEKFAFPGNTTETRLCDLIVICSHAHCTSVRFLKEMCTNSLDIVNVFRCSRIRSVFEK